ncbi:winged helix-turn-helix domain-containing protein [Frateuria soli]|uniref:winged helix-turn-helix domain-containing protein n=1 Tax=Frateuria soli TaxID=1542730 RepID=UPI001E602BFD|nr:winged helix-turn-helix domain-containing protein [Frateuria soli]UGB37391.1 winged helix-turn-helix domain-containing protein [Frateuria soli]
MSWQCGEYTIVPACRRLLRNGQPVELEAKVFDLILLLVENRDHAVGKQEVVTALWGHRPITDAALSQLLYKARRALDDNGERQAVIRTVYGRGLQWAAAVTPVAALPDEAGSVTPPGPASTNAATRRHRWRPFAFAATALAALGLLVFLFVSASRAPPLAAPPRLAMMPTTNATGDPRLDWVSHGLPGLMASLMGEGRDVTVIDALKVARVWDYTPPQGRSRAEHARFVTHADIVVDSRLRKLADRLYELDLHLDAGRLAPPGDIVITGEEPGTLGIQAIARIRRALRLGPPPQVRGVRSGSGYLAETFARGLDEAMRGRWMQAKPYFLLAAQNAPDFLPARFRLGETQVVTDEPDQARQTLEGVLAVARAKGDDVLAAGSLVQLAQLAMNRHRYEEALALLDDATRLAGHDAGMDAEVALKSANVAAKLHRLPLARSKLAAARELVASHQLKQMDANLHNSEAAVAEAEGNVVATEAANRAALAASEAIGNERDARGDAYNLALVLAREGKNGEAIRLFANSYRRSLGVDPWLTFASGDNLAIALLNAGLSANVKPIAAQLLATGKERHNPVWRALALMLRAGSRWYEGDAPGSLADCRQAAALVDPAQDPALWLAIRLSEASAALVAEPSAVAMVERDAEALIAAQKQPSNYAYERRLFQAMAASAAGHAAPAREALEAAAAAPRPNDPMGDNLHYIGLVIALRDTNADAAAIALAGFDAGTAANADVLRLYGQWMARQGDDARRDRAAARLTTLRTEALAALATEPVAIHPASP